MVDQWPAAVDEAAGAAAFLCFLWCVLVLSLFIESLEDFMESLEDFIESLDDLMASELDFIASLLASWVDCGVVLCAMTGDMARPNTTAVAKASTA